MAIEHTAGGTMITGPDVKMYALLHVAHALAFEINTDGRMQLSRISGFQAAKNHGIVPADQRASKKRRLEALRLTVQALREGWPSYEPSELVTKALVG